MRSSAAIFAIALIVNGAFLFGIRAAAAVSSPAFRSLPVVPPAGERAVGFSKLDPQQTGLHFTNQLSLRRVAQNRLIEDGSGVAAGDVDGDGWCDLYFCGLEGGNRLFRNLGGLRFEDVTLQAGVACPGQVSTGVALADVEGDGDLDLLVNGLGTGTRLFLNDGRGRFVEKTDSGLLGGSGARSLALADIDGDGDLDLYVTNYRRATARDEFKPLSVTKRGNRFEVPPQLREQFTVEVTDQGEVVPIELGEPDVLYRNVGAARFEPISWTGGDFLDANGAPLSEPPRDWGLSAMFRDLNADGASDLYVCNDFHSPDRVWFNNGKGQFRAAPPFAFRKTSWASMAVDFADINRDGRDDIFVAEMLGVTRLRRHTQRDNLEGTPLPRLGWGWRAGDITNVTQVMRNTLFLNMGDGQFGEIAQYSGVQASDWTWGTAFLDVDLDGYEDLLIANGHARDHLNSDVQARLAPAGPPKNAAEREALFGMMPTLAVPKRAFRNRQDLTFEDKSREWGFDWTGISNGMALADLDNDGDLDVVLNNLNAGALLMRNESAAPRIGIRIRGLTPNTAGIGARIRVSGGLVDQSQEMISGGRYLSCDDSLRVFAAGNAAELDVELIWRSGQLSIVKGVKANRVYEIVEPVAALVTARADSTTHHVSRTTEDAKVQSSKLKAQIEQKSEVRNEKLETRNQKPGTNEDLETLPVNSAHALTSVATFFEDVSNRLPAFHQTTDFDDYARQPLLPRKMSQNGRGVSWLDLNGDGHDDLLLPAAHGQRPQAWLNDGSGKFTLDRGALFSIPSRGDQTAVLGWQTAPGTLTLVTGISSYELDAPQPTSVAVYAVSPQNAKAVGGLTAGPNVSALAAADFDGDGDIDLFVGGHAEPGRYAVASRSVIFRQHEQRFHEDAENTARLATVGLVNGAVWSDVDSDGDSDLVLACEWGPIRIVRNQGGILTEATQELGLDRFTGWWNGVAAGDFNGDGLMDFIASNWGRNTKYQEFIQDELRLYHGDFDHSGTWDVIEAYWDRELRKEVPWRDYRSLARAIPSIQERFRTYGSYATASVQEILGELLKGTPGLRVNTLESMLFLNRTNHFEARPLPLHAQLSPAFAAVVADFDGDGNEDIFLSQNSFAADRETGRYDGGRGLWLRGDGTGNFAAVSASSSGLAIYGQQRGAAAADFDADGRMDLAVTQHAGPAKLFRNRSGSVGLRVRLHGSAGNENGIGAQLRLRFGERYGPVREIHAGSGYWSQDSTVVVLAKPVQPTHLWIRWPGGEITETAVPPNVIEVGLDGRGKLLAK